MGSIIKKLKQLTWRPSSVSPLFLSALPALMALPPHMLLQPLHTPMSPPNTLTPTPSRTITQATTLELMNPETDTPPPVLTSCLCPTEGFRRLLTLLTETVVTSLRSPMRVKLSTQKSSHTVLQPLHISQALEQIHIITLVSIYCCYLFSAGQK